MNPLEYLRLQLRLEGKEVIKGKLLRQVEIVLDEEVPLMLIAQLMDQNVVAYFDETLQPELHEELAKLCSEISFLNIDLLSTFLQQRDILFELGHYKTYIFPDTHIAFSDETAKHYSKHDPKVQLFGFDGFVESVYAIEQNNKIISACVSTREDDFCGEAWVYTDERYRHQGLAPKVVGVWAMNLISAGKVPFYSHKIQNVASTNLANRLGLQPMFEEIVFAYV